MSSTRRPGVWLAMVALAALAAAAPVSPQGKPTVRVSYIPSDSFAALYIMADRHLPVAGIGVETVRLAGGPEILSQVATGQLHVGGAGMGAAGFNAVHRRQSRRHPARARPRARSESRHGFRRARLDAALEPGARLPQVQGLAAAEPALQFLLSGPGGHRAREEVGLTAPAASGRASPSGNPRRG